MASVLEKVVVTNRSARIELAFKVPQYEVKGDAEYLIICLEEIVEVNG